MISRIIAIGTLSIVLFSCKNFRRNNADQGFKFSDYQIELITVFKIDGKNYSLAYKISGSHDKVMFIELYNSDITNKVGTSNAYCEPVFSEYIDQKFDSVEKATRYPMEANFDTINNKIVIVFDNDDKEVYIVENLL